MPYVTRSRPATTAWRLDSLGLGFKRLITLHRADLPSRVIQSTSS
jgi:hypothetical protein